MAAAVPNQVLQACDQFDQLFHHAATFCTRDNFLPAVMYLSKQLELLGFSPLVMVGQDKLDVISLVNATHGLLHQVNEYERNKKQTEDRSHQVISDLHHCQWLLERQKEECRKRERETCSAKEKERQVRSRLAATESALKKCRDQQRALQNEFELKHSQLTHAMKRRDLENHRLHEQVLRGLRTSERKTSSTTTNKCSALMHVEMNACLTQPLLAGSITGSRRKWDRNDESSRAVEDKWRLAMDGIASELNTLRCDYHTVLHTLKECLVQCHSSLSSPCTDVTELMQLPLSVIRSHLDEMCASLNAQIITKLRESNHLERQPAVNHVPSNQCQTYAIKRSLDEGHTTPRPSRHLAQSGANFEEPTVENNLQLEIADMWPTVCSMAELRTNQTKQHVQQSNTKLYPSAKRPPTRNCASRMSLDSLNNGSDKSDDETDSQSGDLMIRQKTVILPGNFNQSKQLNHRDPVPIIASTPNDPATTTGHSSGSSSTSSGSSQTGDRLLTDEQYFEQWKPNTLVPLLGNLCAKVSVCSTSAPNVNCHVDKSADSGRKMETDSRNERSLGVSLKYRVTNFN